MMPKCRLCLEEKSLCNSHIIPEFVYTYVYTQDHEFIEIGVEKKNKMIPEKKGFRELLFCQECEGRLNKYETYVARLLYDINNAIQKKIKIEVLPSKVRVITQFDFQKMKKFVISILWRLSISKLPKYKEYDLGPYNETIRKILLADDFTTWNSFPFIMSQIVFSNGQTPDLIILHGKGKFKNKSMYSFTIVGFNFDVVVDEKFSEDDNLGLFVHEDEIRLSNLLFSKLGVSNELSNRLFDSDVTEFYEKHRSAGAKKKKVSSS